MPRAIPPYETLPNDFLPYEFLPNDFLPFEIPTNDFFRYETLPYEIPTNEISPNLPSQPMAAILRRTGGHMKRLLIAGGIAAVLGVVAIGQGKTDPALNKLAAEFEAAYNAGDAAKVASMYAEDAVVMPPNEPMIKGRSAIEARLKKEMAKGKVTLKLSPYGSAITGDTAHEAGTTTVTLPDGRTEQEKYLAVYKRVGNEWKVAYDIWNSDAAQK
jgi:uncharacterized protein (TIGR02246 family)